MDLASTTTRRATAVAISAASGARSCGSWVGARAISNRRKKSRACVALTPDTKDWTWVLERPCLECGFDPSNYPIKSFSQTLRHSAHQWALVVGRDDASQRTREDRWSDLEYACHVRDACRIMNGRLASILAEDDPVFPNWDQDETALEEHYSDQDPSLVSEEVIVAAEQLAQRVDSIEPHMWSRPGTRSNGSRFSAETLVRYALHDVLHHLWDVSANQ